MKPTNFIFFLNNPAGRCPPGGAAGSRSGWSSKLETGIQREREREIEKYKRKREKCLRKQEGTEITGKGKRWIPMARKYPSQGEQKGGRSKGHCRVSLCVLPSKMGWAERRHPSRPAYPGKPVKRPRVVLNYSDVHLAEISSMKKKKDALARKWLIYCVRCRLFLQRRYSAGRRKVHK